MPKTLLVEHSASTLVRLRDLDVPFKGLCASRSIVIHNCTERWNKMGRILLGMYGSIDYDLLLYLAGQRWCSLQLSNLIVNVLSIVSRHLHSLIEIIEC